MLGLIFGTRAGETKREPVALMLPRFLLRLTLPLPLLASFLSLSASDGVHAVMGDPVKFGEVTAEPSRPEAGVLDGPNLGVLRAEFCGVRSSVASGSTWVSI